MSFPRYVRSRSDKQLRYKSAAHLTSDCVPEGDTADHAPIVPCGLVAWSLFNDTYTVRVNGVVTQVNKKDIAWKSDKNNKFGKNIYPSNFQKGRLIGGATLNESIPVRGYFHHPAYALLLVLRDLRAGI
uniref:Uncharacterized protein n=1 Tax=Aegilops tauschii subsp. strangulata TaxID=200361 RepID=A0A453J6N4_AEGTS